MQMLCLRGIRIRGNHFRCEQQPGRQRRQWGREIGRALCRVLRVGWFLNSLVICGALHTIEAWLEYLWLNVILFEFYISDLLISLETHKRFHLKLCQ